MAPVEQSAREEQATAYEQIAELCDLAGAHNAAAEWRLRADALLYAEMAELLAEQEAEAA